MDEAIGRDVPWINAERVSRVVDDADTSQKPKVVDNRAFAKSYLSIVMQVDNSSFNCEIGIEGAILAEDVRVSLTKEYLQELRTIELTPPWKA